MYIMDDKPAVIGGQHAPRRRFNGLNQIELFSWSRRKALRVCKRSSGPVELPHCREGCWTVRSTDDGGGGGGHECCCCSTPATHANHHAHHQANKIVAMQLLDDYSWLPATLCTNLWIPEKTRRHFSRVSSVIDGTVWAYVTRISVHPVDLVAKST